MPKGKPWSKTKEKQLKEFFAQGMSVKQIAEKMKKSKQAIRHKIKRMELEVEGQQKKTECPSSSVLEVPDDLPSIEEQLRVLAGVIDKLKTENLNKTDVMRLRSLISAVKNYKELYAEYVGYREIEVKVETALEWLKKLDQERKNMDRKHSQKD